MTDPVETLKGMISSAFFSDGPKVTMADVADMLAEARYMGDEIKRLRKVNEAIDAENRLLRMSVDHLKAQLDLEYRQKIRQMT